MSHLPIPSDFSLYDITVKETWSAECRVAVMAKDPSAARRLALRLVCLSSFDADSEGVEIDGMRETTAADLDGEDDIDNDAYIDWPDESKQPVEVNCRELLDQLLEVDPEIVERLRLEAIERSNGQLPLTPA